MRVLLAAAHTSVASVPKDERVRTDAFHTFIGIEVARDDDAARTVALVLLFTLLETPAVALLVFALITAASELDAVVTSD